MRLGLPNAVCTNPRLYDESIVHEAYLGGGGRTEYIPDHELSLQYAPFATLPLAPPAAASDSGLRDTVRRHPSGASQISEVVKEGGMAWRGKKQLPTRASSFAVHMSLACAAVLAVAIAPGADATCAHLHDQCGGQGFFGPTTCDAESTCTRESVETPFHGELSW